MSKQVNGETETSNWLNLTVVFEKSSTVLRKKKILGHVSKVYGHSVCMGLDWQYLQTAWGLAMS